MLSKTAFKKVHRTHGQAIVEFAIVLPILLAVLVGILEAGRMMFIYSVVTNASREASRFGSAVGYGDDGFHKYRYCYGIQQMVVKSAYFIEASDLTVDIRYDKGPDDPIYADGHGPDTTAEWNLLTQCNNFSSTAEDTDITLDDDSVQYRILVSVSAPYSPMVSLIPFPSRNFDSSSARTILGYVNLDTGLNSVSSDSEPVGGGSSTNTPTPTPTNTPIPPTDTPTATATLDQTSTPTNTPGDLVTFTPIATTDGTETSTPTATATNTPTATPTLTPTLTPTNTPTSTPTSTPTIVPGCSNITASIISVPDSSGPRTMSMTITNPHAAVTMSSVVVTWNAFAAPSGANLVLVSASLGNTTFWSGTNTTGTATIPATQVIPGNNATTKILFTFAKNYQITSGTPPTITINLSTVGCEGIQIHNQ